MSVNNKQLATILLGAAAALGAIKYAQMSEEEKEKLTGGVKDKANKLKQAALDAEGQAMDYFNDLKAKGTDLLKEYGPKVEEFLEGLFKSGGKTPTAATAGTAAESAGSDGKTV